MDRIYAIILLTILFVVYIPLIIGLLIKQKKFNFLGNTYLYVVTSYLVCLCFSLYINYNPIGEAITTNPFLIFAVSLFDALKMIALAFDRSLIAPFFESTNVHFIIATGYVVSSILALIFTSISIILFVYKSFKAKLLNTFKRMNKSNDICYIFSDPKSDAAARVGEELKKQNKIVIMFLQRSLMKTQEGTEYRDFLIGKGFDVKIESYSSGLCTILLRHFTKKRNVYVYGLFSSDNNSIELANYFLEALKKKKAFQSLINKSELSSEELEQLNRYKVFLTYSDADIDLNNNYSKESLHIINTASIYDIISTNFIMDNQLCDLIDLSKVDNNIDNMHMHVSFLGFGKVNKPIFEKMTYAYQLWGDNINKVHYHIVDKDSDSLLEPCLSDYTNKELINSKEKFSAPYLYDVDSELNNADLCEYETLDTYIKNLSKGESRFSTNGFDIFLVSIADTNKDIETATLLRKALIKNIQLEKLKHVKVYVRIGGKTIGDNFISNNENAGFVYRQHDIVKDDTVVPVIIYGENALLSDYISNHHKNMHELGVASIKAYYGSDIQKAKNIWIRSNKKEVIDNLSSIYSIRTKMALFNYDLDYGYKVVNKGNDNTPLNELLDNYLSKANYPDDYDLNNPLYKLASLEHNRWTASSYQNHKYSLWDSKDYLDYNKKAFANKKTGTTKYYQAKHCCMLTNKSLLNLREEIIKANKDLKDYADKLAFYNDIVQIKDIYEGLMNLHK